MEPSQLQQVQPASLLWAHELRRENVQLVSQMDKLNTILTSATNTISTLHESVELLTARIQHLEEQHKQQQQEFEHKIIELENDRMETQNWAVRLDQACKDFGDLAMDNQALRDMFSGTCAKVDAVEADNATLRGEVKEVSKNVNTIKSGNRTLTRELGEASRGLHALVAENEALLKGEIQGVSGKVDTLETENGTLKWNLDNVIRTFGRIECENEEVKERVCVVEKEAAVQEKQVARVVKWMSMRTMGEDKEKRGPRRAAADQDQDMHMPDSNPTPASRQSARLSSQRVVSETTWGSLNDLDRPCTSVSNKNSGHGSLQKDDRKSKDQKILESIRQKRRTLKEYISSTDALRACHTSIPEEALVMAFMAGLDDDDLRMQVIDVTRQAGLSWESVMSSVQSKEQGPRERAENNNNRAPGRRNVATRTTGKRKENRRRTIPIVPADEEDELFVT